MNDEMTTIPELPAHAAVETACFIQAQAAGNAVVKERYPDAHFHSWRDAPCFDVHSMLVDMPGDCTVEALTALHLMGYKFSTNGSFRRELPAEVERLKDLIGMDDSHQIERLVQDVAALCIQAGKEGQRSLYPFSTHMNDNRDAMGNESDATLEHWDMPVGAALEIRAKQLADAIALPQIFPEDREPLLEKAQTVLSRTMGRPRE